MSFKLGDIAAGARDLRRSCWPKRAHESQGAAEAHLRALARREEQDPQALNVYRCRACDGWHVGHHTRKERMSKAFHRLIDIFVKNVALVKAPATKRKFLIVKSEGRPQMKPTTFSEVLALHARERATTVTKPDLDRLEALVTDAMRDVPVEKAATSAVEEREKLIAAYIQAHPAETRANAVAAIYTTHDGLYDRCRLEETVSAHGATLREIYARAEAGTPVLKSDVSVDDEVMRRVNNLVAKMSGATVAQALDFLGREDPELMRRWMRESYA